MAAIGLCSQRLPDVAKTCLEGLLALALSGNHHFFARGSLLIGASIFLYPLLVFSFLLIENFMDLISTLQNPQIKTVLQQMRKLF